MPTATEHRELTTRDRILDAAAELFYRDGIRAVGVDRIVAHSGVAKMTLYKHFRSKDALVRDVLVRRSRQWREWFAERVAAAAPQPERRLMAVFDVLAQWFADPAFRGCIFINSSAEIAVATPAYAVLREHHAAVREYLRGLAVDAGAARPDDLASHWLTLINGAVVNARVSGSADAAADARRAAEALLAGPRPVT
ncbi:MAG: TetR/AcrR family transcriptional regulator [Phycisphaerae bacterium]